MKVLIDTNVLISAILRDRTPEVILLYIVDHPDRFDWIVSSTILVEYKAVLSRPKFKIPESVQAQWLNLIDQATCMIDVNISVDFPRDPNDAKFLECAIAANADYFITGDRDFRESIPLTTQILSVAEFQSTIIQS